MRVLRWIAALVGVALLVLFLVGVAARFADGPVAIFPGGALARGELVREPPADWSFARDVAEIELQLLDPPRSRTTWIVVHEGAPYVPAGFMRLPLWKQWPHEAARDGRAVARIEGRRYPLRAVRVTDPALTTELAALVAAKYELGEPGAAPPDPEEVWLFRLEPRAAE